jgi:peptide-methionine (R)-S-oxide reductase
MATRRQFLTVTAVALGLAPVVALAGRSERPQDPPPHGHFPVSKTDEEWRALLTPEQYRVLRRHGTERAHSSPLNKENRRGTFVCAACGHPLFASEAKYDSGTGWPSFWRPLSNAVGTSIDRSLWTVRTEVHCLRCGGHLGHVFSDGPPPTGLRYCINGAAMKFTAVAGA